MVVQCIKCKRLAVIIINKLFYCAHCELERLGIELNEQSKLSRVQTRFRTSRDKHISKR